MVVVQIKCIRFILVLVELLFKISEFINYNIVISYKQLTFCNLKRNFCWFFDKNYV